MSSWRSTLQSQAQQRLFSEQQSRFKLRERSGLQAHLNGSEKKEPRTEVSKTTVLRLRGLPADKAKLDKIETRLKQEPELKHLEILPDCMKNEGSICLIEWRGTAGTGPLGCSFNGPGDTCHLELEGQKLSLDQNFYGFTQLYQPLDPDDVQAE